MKTNVIYNKNFLPKMLEVKDDSIDLIFTDPPYFQNRAKNIKNLNNHKDVVTEFGFDKFKDEDDYLDFIKKSFLELYRVAKKGASGYMFCSDDYVSYINRIVENVGFKFRKVIHWHKTNPFPAISTRKMFANSMELIVHFSKGTPKTWNSKNVNEMHNFINTSITKKDIENFIKKTNSINTKKILRLLKNSIDNQYIDNLINSPICMGNERTKHKTQKPLKVCIPYIEISSNPGDIILDPFMGSGTTAITCLNLNRNFIGYEASKEYCKIIEKRLAANVDIFTNHNPKVKY